MTLKSEVRVRLTARETGGNAIAGQLFEPTIEEIVQFAHGTGAKQADLAFFAERSIAASSSDDVDLAGVLASAFGTTLAMAELAAVLIINKAKDPAAAANLSNITLGGGSNPFLGFLGGTTPTIGPIGPGGGILLWAPGAAGIGTVTAGTGDILRIANGAGGTAKVQLGLIARSA